MKDLKSIVELYMDAIPRRDFGKLRQIYHRQYSYTSSDGKRQEGPDAGIAVVEMYTNAFPDMKLDIQHLHIVGNIAIIEFIARGTHKGELMGIGPTNIMVEVPCCNITEVRDGKIYAERQYFDYACLMQQLGECFRQSAGLIHIDRPPARADHPFHHGMAVY